MTGPPSPPDAGGQRRPPATGDHVVVGRALIVLAVAVVVGIVLIGVAGRPPVLSESSTVATSITTTTTPAATTTTGSSTTTTAHHSTTTTRPASTTTHPGHGGTTTTTTTVPRSSVKVQVANGTTVSGAATHVTQELSAQGWATTAPVNTTSQVSESAVYYAAGQQAAAGTIATELNLSPASVKPLTTSAPVSSTTGVDVVVVVGPDLTAQINGSTTTTG